MELTSIKDIIANQDNYKTDFILAVSSRSVRSMKNGNPYVVFNLSDGKDSISMSVFNSDNILDNANIIKGKGIVNTFRGAKQLIGIDKELKGVKEIIKNPREDNIPKNVENLNKLIDKINNQFLKRLVTDLVVNEPYMKEAPGAVIHHHNYLGGLLEHTIEVAQMSYNLASVLPGASTDIAIAGALIHDIGKMDLYKFKDDSKFEIEYDQMNGLLEHITMGIMRIQEWELKNKGILSDKEKEMLIIMKHIILSHHGLLEYGSPVTPKTLEASIVSKADGLSALYQPIVESAVEDDGKFTVNYISIDSIGKVLSPKYINELTIATRGNIVNKSSEGILDNSDVHEEDIPFDDFVEDDFNEGPPEDFYNMDTVEFGV